MKKYIIIINITSIPSDGPEGDVYLRELERTAADIGNANMFAYYTFTGGNFAMELNSDKDIQYIFQTLNSVYEKSLCHNRVIKIYEYIDSIS